jgi:hypothetical protein
VRIKRAIAEAYLQVDPPLGRGTPNTTRQLLINALTGEVKCYFKSPITRLHVHSVALNGMQRIQTVKNYSYLSAIIGSTRMARRAGM